MAVARRWRSEAELAAFPAVARHPRSVAVTAAWARPRPARWTDRAPEWRREPLGLRTRPGRWSRRRSKLPSTTRRQPRLAAYAEWVRHPELGACAAGAAAAASVPRSTRDLPVVMPAPTPELAASKPPPSGPLRAVRLRASPSFHTASIAVSIPSLLRSRVKFQRDHQDHPIKVGQM